MLPSSSCALTPPSSHLRRSPDLVGEGGTARDEGGVAEGREGEAARSGAGWFGGSGAKASGGRSGAPQRRGARRAGASGARERAEGERFGLGTAVREKRKKKNKKQARRGAAETGERRRRGPAAGGGSVRGRPRSGGRANHGSGERSAAGGGAPGRRCRAPRPSPISRLYRFTPYWILTAANRRRK